MVRRKRGGVRLPPIRGELQSPVLIAPESVDALVNGLVASLPAAVGTAVDNRLQGRKLLREIASQLNVMNSKLDRVVEKLDRLGRKSSLEHSKILRSVRGS
ncbi:MAG: hypothetical protein QXT68_05900 [Halobacteria archaeon]